ncbi:hypothetical protein POTOM_059667 [Populus tomentosa]|uniref:Uncharacterized protein n=1 Tax=Populus tomentosa TaxID=118781 RepID=A0A8X7XXH1_POPTO|nr:hypothetical protein POTOM_059667 [Populus tomentosa]
MAGNLVKEDSSSVQDLQDPSITCSGHKRRRGSVQPSSSRAGKKSKQDIDRDHRAKKKEETNDLKKENGILQESNWRLLGKTDQMMMELRERGEEVISLRIMQDRQNNSIRELEEKLIALGKQHQQEIQALKEELERQMQLCSSQHIDMGILGTLEMNNPVETPAPAQATSNFVNSDVHFASQMA